MPVYVYAILTGLTALLFFLTGFFVYTRDTRRPLYQRCFIFSTSVSLWSLGYFITLLEMPNYLLNITASRLSHAFGAFIPVTYLHFVWIILKRESKKYLFFWAYLFSGLMFCMSLTPLVVKVLMPKMGLQYYPEWGILYPVYSSLFLIFPGYAQFEMGREILRLKGTERTRLIYFFVALGLAFSGGISLFLLIFNLPFPPYLSVLIILYPPMMAYTILVHKFMDIEIIIKKTLVFTGLFAVVMTIVGVVTTIMQTFLGQFISITPMASTAISVTLTILLYDPARKFLTNATDLFLFQKKESIKVILNRLSQNIITILDIDKLGRIMLSTLEESLRLESGAILLKDESESKYKIQDSFGIKIPPSEEFQKNDPLIQYFLAKKKVLNIEDSIQFNGLPPQLKEKLKQFKAHECLPLFLSEDLIGLLILGKKKSDQEFSPDELDYFPTVASQAAIALSNARSIAIQRKSQIEFAQQSKMAAIGTLSAGISHEVKNPLQIIKSATGFLRLNKKLGLYKEMTKEAYENAVLDIIDKIEASVERANGVIERLSAFAKKPKEIKVEPINLERVAEEVLGLLGSEFEKNSIQVKKDYAKNLPLVLADLHAVEQVILNLLVNAGHAIKEKKNNNGSITIHTESNQKEVEISIQDTGSGIAPENFEKIFDPFFTTKDTSRNTEPDAIKGTGLGLFLVREMVKQYGGRIQVESKVGTGTTFHVFFPVHQGNSKNV